MFTTDKNDRQFEVIWQRNEKVEIKRSSQNLYAFEAFDKFAHAFIAKNKINLLYNNNNHKNVAREIYAII